MKTLQLSPVDNVAVALADLPVGHTCHEVILREPIPRGHKFAIRSIGSGEPVIKFGAPIGLATGAIEPGRHIHSHNLQTALETPAEWNWQPEETPVSARDLGSFDGYLRPDGRAAIRNELWIINTVACVNQTANRLAERVQRDWIPAWSQVDGCHAFPHPYGCSQLGDDLDNTRRILAGLINHPHAGGVLILGLGCENNRLREQVEQVAASKRERIRFFNTQEVGDEMEAGLEALRELGETINQDSRESLPLTRLVLGMKCGGSDGLSGITANPVVGRVADWHAAAGGTVLLTEIPEMFGAEASLLRRCQTPETRDQLDSTIEQFKAYFRHHDQPISENPSPGNREGGITTLEEKSLGCIQKGGLQATVRAVLEYGDVAPLELGGLGIVNSPGNDGVSTTALTVAGANVVLFTTGRGTPLGGPAPTLKIASNTGLADAKPGWIDFDAGRLLEEKSLDALAGELLEQIRAIASGTEMTRNERNGYREIAIWKTGVTL